MSRTVQTPNLVVAKNTLVVNHPAHDRTRPLWIVCTVENRASKQVQSILAPFSTLSGCVPQLDLPVRNCCRSSHVRCVRDAPCSSSPSHHTHIRPVRNAPHQTVSEPDQAFELLLPNFRTLAPIAPMSIVELALSTNDLSVLV